MGVRPMGETVDGRSGSADSSYSFFFFFWCRSWQMMLVRGLAERWSEPGGGSWMGAEVFGVDEG